MDLTSPSHRQRPRVGVPWRRSGGEKDGKRRAYDCYLDAVRRAGGEPVEIPLNLSLDELARVAESVEAFVLPGSGADVDPTRFDAKRHPKAAAPDLRRERADDQLLDHAFAAGKPVLAICYGVQSLNVHLGGSLVQDIPSEFDSEINHDPGMKGRHAIEIEGGRLGELNRGGSALVNSSHHQSVLQPGRGLKVTGRAADGVIEAVEWTGGPEWVVGVQWHPERMEGDPLAAALFARLVSEAQVRSAGQPVRLEKPSV